MLPDTDADPEDVELDAQDAEDGDGADSDADERDALDDEPGEGGEDHSQDDDAGGHEGETRGSPEVRHTGRAKNDFGRLREERRLEKERADRLEREVAEMRQQLGGRHTEETRRAEQERLALMTADEKLDYYRQQDRAELDRRFGQLQFQSADNADRDRFERLCERTPAIAAVADEVERILATERAAGRAGASREIIAKYVIGDRALKNAGRAKGKQVKRANESRDRQAARPVQSRSNVQGGNQRRGSESEARRKRLEDINI